MATKTAADEKLSNVDFDLWAALAALDRKDYDWWDTLTAEQQRKFVPYMMLHWASSVGGKNTVAQYYLRSVDYYANTHMFNERVTNHPKLQWLMLCASSPGAGKQQHVWLSHLSSKITALKERAKSKDVVEYLGKLHRGVAQDTLREFAAEYVEQQHRGVYLAQEHPALKIEDIHTLNTLLSDEEIKEHRAEREF